MVYPFLIKTVVMVLSTGIINHYEEVKGFQVFFSVPIIRLFPSAGSSPSFPEHIDLGKCLIRFISTPSSEC